MATAGLECSSKGGSALQVEWSMALVSCSQQDMKRDPQEALALPEFHNPPGRPQFVSQEVEVWGTLAVCHCPIYSGANLPFPTARMRMLFPSASISSGTASLGWAKIPPRMAKSLQDGINSPVFLCVGRSVVFARCRSSLQGEKWSSAHGCDGFSRPGRGGEH